MSAPETWLWPDESSQDDGYVTSGAAPMSETMTRRHPQRTDPMTDTASLSDFPQDVQDAAAAAHGQFADSRVKDNLSVIIARAIMADRLRASPAPDRVSVTDEMVTRGCEKACWLAEPYTAPREGGVPIECDISEADAEEINRLARREMRAILEAALSEASK